MGDSEIRDLERRVLKGDESALFNLRVAYWRAGPPERAIPGTGLRLAQGAPLIRQKPTPDTLAGDVLSVRALNALCRSAGILNVRETSLHRVASLATLKGLEATKLTGPKTLAEIRAVMDMAGLAILERHEPNMARYKEGDRVDSARHGRGIVRSVEWNECYGWLYRLELDNGYSTGGAVLENTLALVVEP